MIKSILRNIRAITSISSGQKMRHEIILVLYVTAVPILVIVSTEHYRYVLDLDNGCNGYKGLLEYYERMESQTSGIPHDGISI